LTTTFAAYKYSEDENLFSNNRRNRKTTAKVRIKFEPMASMNNLKRMVRESCFW